MESLFNQVKHFLKIPTPGHPSVSPFPDYSAVVCSVPVLPMARISSLCANLLLVTSGYCHNNQQLSCL